MRNRRISLMLALAGLALGCGVGFADDAKKVTDPTPDDELIEFLGSVDSAADSIAQSDDGSWIEYLSQTDIDKAAKADQAAKTASAPAASGTTPADAAGEKRP
jgi:hypothetical protein